LGSLGIVGCFIDLFRRKKQMRDGVCKNMFYVFAAITSLGQKVYQSMALVELLE